VPRLLLGKPIADTIAASLRDRVRRLTDHGHQPTLAVISIEAAAAARVYATRLERIATRLGMRVVVTEADEARSLNEAIGQANQDPKVHGVILLAPLPSDIDEEATVERLAPEKDVEGVHPYNAGRLARGEPSYVPSTAEAVLLLIKESGVRLAGAHAVVVGRSPVIGQPCALLLVRENATVSIAHRSTRDLASITRQADVLVVAVGHAGIIRGDMLRPGVVIADAGISVTPTGVVGDVDFASAAPVAAAITPVPGGVGALTTTLLLRNTVTAAEKLGSSLDQ
jgi:methylenetetrahydrofolate dehydrogenase (NADP+) / methenyltetrahydrofolate cyclohydrolase